MNLERIPSQWDLIIIGGGITGAGILNQAARSGLKALLVEQNDFAWGTSSRSSKLVHGGLRYLKEGRFLLTLASVRERQRLMREAPGLIDPLDFYAPVYDGRSPGREALAVGLSIYSLMAGRKQHRYYSLDEFSRRMPHLHREGLTGGFSFLDAQVDDARLVLRVIQEGVAAGGTALNYTRALEIQRRRDGRVCGILAGDAETGRVKPLAAPAVINATGVFAETLQPSPQKGLHIRPLRGSHLFFPAWALPLPQAISFSHPEDRRPIFAIPWEEAVLVGTTDVDHGTDLMAEPAITLAEARYLLEGVRAFFPAIPLSLDDCLSTMAGVRPVLSKGGRDPSAESREHVIWVDKGLVTITGGKLTTFRRLAWDALNAVRPFLEHPRPPDREGPVFESAPVFSPPGCPLPDGILCRLFGRYGRLAWDILANAAPEDLEPVPGTRMVWAEFPHAAQREQIRHLTDLLLRRVRAGILCPRGGADHLERIQRLCRPVLTWDPERWEIEKRHYLANWSRHYHLPPTASQERKEHGGKRPATGH